MLFADRLRGDAIIAWYEYTEIVSIAAYSVKDIVSCVKNEIYTALVHTRVGFIAYKIVEISPDESFRSYIFNQPLAELIVSSISNERPAQNFMHFSPSLENWCNFWY